MRKLSLEYIEGIGAVFGILFGSLLHFTFELSNQNTFVGLFSAVNESVWEHTKLFLLPVLLFAVIEYLYLNNLPVILWAKVIEILFDITFIIVFFYTYTGALGIESLAIDIISFMVAVSLGKYLSFRIIKSKRGPKIPAIFSALILLAVVCFFVVSALNPPKLPLFLDQNTQTYGLP